MNYEGLIKSTLVLGTLLLENGAEIYRVEESMQRILRAYRMSSAQVFAIPNLILISAEAPNGTVISNTKRVYARHTNFDRICALNSLCRHICDDLPEVIDIQRDIARIQRGPIYSVLAVLAGASAVGLFFTLMLGGSGYDAAVAAFACFLGRLVCMQMERFHANTFFVAVVGSFIHTTVAMLFFMALPFIQYDKIIVGTLMILLPGVLFTTAVRDIIARDVLAGMIEGVEAMLVSVAIAIGSVLAFALTNMIGGWVV